MKRSPLASLVALLAASASLSAQALLADIHPGIDTSFSSAIGGLSASANGKVWFVADDLIHGAELWISDGTTGGTRMVVDYTPGPSGTAFTALSAIGNSAIFVHFGALWAADSTTQSVTRLSPTDATFNGYGITVEGSLAFFGLWTPALGEELWCTDGTPAGTRVVVDLAPGTSSSNPRSVISDPAGGGVFFVSQLPTAKLWRTDGTTAGTTELAVNTPWRPLSAGITYILAAGAVGILVSSGSDLFVSDASITPAVLVATGTQVDALGAAALQGRFAFLTRNPSGARELWASDGTLNGTGVLATVSRPGDPTTSQNVRITEHAGRAHFIGYDAQHGIEPWVTDGTIAGTTILADVFPGVWDSNPRSFVSSGSRLYFAAYRWDVHEEPFVSDGTTVGTRLLADVNPGASLTSNPQSLTPVGSGIFFTALDGVHGYEPFFSDGTTVGTRLIADIAKRGLGSDPKSFARFGQRFVFTADDGSHGVEPWISDGTSSGTRLIADLNPGAASSYPRDLIEWRGRLWFHAEDPTEGRELWTSDGTAAGTRRFAVVMPGQLGGSISPFAIVGDRLAFWVLPDFNSAELWVSDGTQAGTVLLDFNPGVTGRANTLVPLGNHLYFAGVDAAHGLGLWRTDGTLAGTTLVRDMSPGAPGGHISGLAAVGNALWFAGSELDFPFPVDAEPWISDGTTAGTRRVIDLVPGSESSHPFGFVHFLDQTWFVGSSRLDYSLYVSDGTASGTTALGPISTIVRPNSPTSTEDLLFVTGGHGITVTDGTPVGTATIAIPSASSPAIEQPVRLGASSRIVFAATSEFQNRELWTSDGTVAGTRQLVDAFPGPLPSTPNEIRVVGDHLLWSAATPEFGREAHHLRLAELQAAVADAFGQGCEGSNGRPRIGFTGTPRLGDTKFTVTLSQARPNSAAFALVSPNLGPGGEFGGCIARLAPPAILLPMSSSPTGASSLRLSVPNDPNLVGVALYFEWIVADPLGHFAGSLAMSDLLEVVIGS